MPAKSTTIYELDDQDIIILSPRKTKRL